MIVTRNFDLEGQFASDIAASFDGPRKPTATVASPQSVRTGTEVHMSDLLSPRLTYYRRTSPKPTEITEALYYLAGRGHEDVFGRIAGLEKAAPRFKDGISYSPDFRWNGLPTEFKTRRRNLAKPGEEASAYEEYLFQLKGYCCLDEVNLGLLIVLSLLEGQRGDPLNPTRPVLAVYTVSFEDAELREFKQELEQRRASMVKSIETGDPAGLPLCADWKCGSKVKTVLTPPRCLTCARDFDSVWGLNKHLQSKIGKGHQYQDETASWKYIPRCKWYLECKPNLIDKERGA